MSRTTKAPASLPENIVIPIRPEYAPYCVRGDEGNCVVDFGIWTWGEENGFNPTHVKTKLDGTVRFNIDGYTGVWKPQADAKRLADIFDRTGRVPDDQLALRPEDAKWTKMKRREVRQPQEKVWLLNHEAKTYLPAPSGTSPRARGAYTGTSKTLKEKYPDYIWGGEHGNVSERRQNFMQLKDELVAA